MRVGAALLILCGCGSPMHSAADAGAWWDKALGGCLAQQGPAPRTIPQMVERINALPHPVSVACVVASLPRPLTLVASTSVFSAQPADGRQSPRVFLLFDKLILSVALAGPGAKLLEFGELMTPSRTLKGELEFPVTGPLALDAPFTRVRMGADQTNCALCHRGESPYPAIEGSFVSTAFRPEPGNLIPLSEFRQQLAICDPVIAPDRCALWVALLGLGPTQQGAFSTKFELFIQ